MAQSGPYSGNGLQHRADYGSKRGHVLEGDDARSGFRLCSIDVILTPIGAIGLVMSTIVFSTSYVVPLRTITPSTAKLPMRRASQRRCTKKSVKSE